MKTDEERPDYIAESQEALEMLGKGYENAAEIHPPKTVQAIRDGGLEEYKVWGWVKISANFINHIRKLKGAKLAIWQVISLSIDEKGECHLSIQEIADLSGYSYSETHESLKELDDMKYLSIGRETGRKSLYSPNFAARGSNKPNDDLSRKARGSDDTPLQPGGEDPSSPPIENAQSSIKELKESLSEEQIKFIEKSGLEWILFQPDVTMAEIELAIKEHSGKSDATRMFEKALGFSKPLPWWSNKEWTEFSEWVCKEYKNSVSSFGEYNVWRNTPYTKGGIANTRIRGFVKEFYDSWDMFKMSVGSKAEEDKPTPAAFKEYKPKEGHYVPNPNPKPNLARPR